MKQFCILSLLILALMGLAACGSGTLLLTPSTDAATSASQGDSPMGETIPPQPAKTTPAPTATPEQLSAAQLAAIQPNELGWPLVLEYHLIDPAGNNEYTRTPESLRGDLAWLHANDFYPIRFRDLAEGRIDIPAGKSPVVLTFDDSSSGQFRYLDDGSIDPNSAMGVLLAFSKEHPDFPPVATFFPLLDVDVDERILWGQPDFADMKLRTIVALGGEVGSHTVSHERLDMVSEERARWQLAFSAKWLEDRIGNGYKVTSLSLPLGIYPPDESWIHSGESEGVTYAYRGAAEVAGGVTPSPYAAHFDPYHIMRAQAIPGYLEDVFAIYENQPGLKYVSDGNPNRITIPTEETIAPQLQGIFDESQWPNEVVVRYARE